MRPRKTKINLPIMVLLGLLIILPASSLAGIFGPGNYYDRQLDIQIELLLNNPGSPNAVLRLHNMEAIKFKTAWDGRVRETYKKVIAHPEAPPELKAHALWYLSRLDIKAGQLQEAERKQDMLGFVTDWMVIGPFDNEGKIGFETAYPPETELNIEAKYEGKEREVAWRRYPDIARFNYMGLSAIFVPGTDVAAYALTFIKSETEQDAAFRFGSDDAIKIWVDDALLYADDGHHSATFDQASAGVKLRKGWNKVLLKVTQGSGGWGFMFRITRPDGSAIKGLIVNADPDVIPDLVKETVPREKLEEVSVFDYVSRMREIAANNPDNARANAELGDILNMKQAFDTDEKEDLKALERAVALEPTSRPFLLKLAPLYSDKNKTREAYETVIENHPACVAPYYQLGNYYTRLGFPKKAYSYYTQAVRVNRNFFPAKIALAEHYKNYGRPDEAAKIVSQLTVEYPNVPYLAFYSIGFWPSLVEPDELLRRCAKYLEYDYADKTARNTMISIYKKRGWMDNVLEQWGVMNDMNPSATSGLIEAAKYYTGIMEFDKAQSYIDRVLAIRPEDPAALQFTGNISHWRDRTDDAVGKWKEALEVRPQNRDLREYIEYLKPKEKPFEDAYKVDVAELLKDFNPAPADYPDDSSVFLLEQNVWEVHTNGLANRFSQQVIKVLKQKGTEDFKYRYATCVPGRDDVDIQAAKIYKLDDEGNIMKVINASGPFEQSLSNESSKLYYNVIAQIHFFSNLEVGDVIEYTYKINQVAAKNLYADYFGNISFIQGTLPKRERRIVYITPSEKEFYYHQARMEETPEITEQDGKRIYSWTVRDVPKIKTENMMPGFAEVASYIHISTFRDWKDMGDWYWGLIQDQFTLDQESKKVTAELIEGKETMLDKVRAIHNYVVQNTRYIGLEFGIHGHKQYKAYQVFSRKYGDCKDKAGLMIAMLKEAGINSDIVVIRTRQQGLVNDFPSSLAVFNHAICYVPELDLYLDGTAEYSGTTELPYSDQGVSVLLVSEDKREFTRTPFHTSDDSKIVDVYNVDVDAEGGIIINGDRNMTGQYNAYYRRLYQEEKTRKENFEKSWRRILPSTEVISAEFSDLKDLESSISYSYKINAPDYVEKGDDGSLMFKGFFGGYNLTKNYANLSERKYDVIIDFPWTNEKTIKYKLPEGFKAVELPENLKLENEFASCDFVYEKSDGLITVKMKFIMKANRITIEQYQDFREFCRLVDEKQNEKIRISK